MAIYGVGLDLVKTERLERMLERWEERLEERIFTPVERETCARRKTRAQCLALRFAAKEAFAKALGTGLRPPVLWRDIEVRNSDLGRPEIVLSPRAQAFCRERGVSAWHLSLTDDGAYGAALVILETEKIGP